MIEECEEMDGMLAVFQGQNADMDKEIKAAVRNFPDLLDGDIVEVGRVWSIASKTTFCDK